MTERRTIPNWLHDRRVQIAMQLTKGDVTVDVKATPAFPRGSTLTCLQRPDWRGHYDACVGGEMALHHIPAIAKVADAQGLFG